MLYQSPSINHPTWGHIPIFSQIGRPAFVRLTFKVSASIYWRSKIRGRNFGLKLKFYYTYRPLGTRIWHQNLNWTPNKSFLLVKVMTDWSIPENRLKSLIKMSHFVSNSNSDAIFVFPGVDLYNRILISSQNSDLGFSTSSTMRPKLQRPWGRPRMDLGGWNLAWDLRVGPYSKYVWGKAVQAFSKNSARPSRSPSKRPHLGRVVCKLQTRIIAKLIGDCTVQPSHYRLSIFSWLAADTF